MYVRFLHTVLCCNQKLHLSIITLINKLKSKGLLFYNTHTCFINHTISFLFWNTTVTVFFSPLSIILSIHHDNSLQKMIKKKYAHLSSHLCTKSSLQQAGVAYSNFYSQSIQNVHILFALPCHELLSANKHHTNMTKPRQALHLN